MLIDVVTGCLQEAQQCVSPNYDERPEHSVSSLIVVHNISLPPGQFGGSAVNELFTNCLDPDEHAFFAEICHLRVASHLLIRRCGEIVQFVPFHQRAFHAGVSKFRDKERCNDFSIGIELEGSDYVAFTEQQYLVLMGVIKTLCLYYPELDHKMITGHQHIAPGRKTDPGPFFDWERLKTVFKADLPAQA